MTEIEGLSRMDRLIQQEQILVSSEALAGVEPEVLIAVTNILELPEGLLNSEAAKKQFFIDVVKPGENELVAKAVGYDAADHIGTMQLLNDLIHNPPVSITEEDAGRMQEAMDFQLQAACHAIRADLHYQNTKDTSGLRNYLSEMMDHIQQSILSGNLDEESELTAHEDFEEYSRLLSMVK